MRKPPRQKNTFVRLPDTPTYRKQSAFFMPMVLLPGDLLVGVLEIQQTAGQKTLVTRYLIEQLDNKQLGVGPHDFCFRVFQSSKNTVRRDGDMPVHYTRVTPDEDTETFDNCSCEGFMATGNCKHRAALAYLAERGAFRPLRCLPVFKPQNGAFPARTPARKGKPFPTAQKRKDGPKRAGKRKGKLK